VAVDEVVTVVWVAVGGEVAVVVRGVDGVVTVVCEVVVLPPGGITKNSCITIIKPV
jgi:hypothetical protein